MRREPFRFYGKVSLGPGLGNYYQNSYSVMELNFRTFRLLSPHRNFLKAAGNCFVRLRCLSGGRNPPADPPCQHQDRDCHAVDDPCESARNVFKYLLPFDKNMQRQRQQNLLEVPCCVSRLAAKAPCPAQPCLWNKRIREQHVEKPPFRSMWEPHFGPARSNCKGRFPRFDAIYYEPSDKTRIYQRTWSECPPVKERLKKVCCLDGIQPPEVLKRVKEPCPLVTCRFDYSRMRHICENAVIDPASKCCKIHWPCCKPARCTVDCRPTRKREHCTRLRAPHPCFSDMYRVARARRSIECPLGNWSMCEGIRLQIRRDTYSLKGSYC
ncbi:uncharacterized protein LOC6580364 [Drosophila mojavensis]|uniref:uncharacterized protein LOC6580364 n=1 Tax=Drosophila mojavensis TaxID=7230 RepID=UPI001CD05CE3|nr:uncharacterized protein LOC6580364 [Drosophila mojavensis]